MRIDWNAPAIVRHGEEIAGIELYLDESRVAGYRLIHRIVDDFREQMVQRLLVGAPDIHARPAPHGFQTLENLDVGRTVALAAILVLRRPPGRGPHQRVKRPRRRTRRGLRLLAEVGKEVVAVVH